MQRWDWAGVGGDSVRKLEEQTLLSFLFLCFLAVLFVEEHGLSLVEACEGFSICGTQISVPVACGILVL